MPRIMTKDYPIKEYQRRNKDIKTVVSNTQRKNLLSVVEFLTKYSTYDKLLVEKEEIVKEESLDSEETSALPQNEFVIYAGGADGTIFPLLSELFPFITFILIDPSKFNIKEIPNKILINPNNRDGFLTDEVARNYSKKYPKSLFISNVRSLGAKTLTIEESEKLIQKDMRDQMRWAKLLQCKKAMLKFRLPYNHPCNEGIGGEIEYFSGDIYLPLYGGKTACETQLITDCEDKLVKYDFVNYEKKMFFFNTIDRTKIYPNILTEKTTDGNDTTSDDKKNLFRDIGIDRCYDCSTEVDVLSSYIKRFYGEKKVTPKKIISIIRKIDVGISAKKILTIPERKFELRGNISRERNRRFARDREHYVPSIKHFEKRRSVLVKNLDEKIKSEKVHELFSSVGQVKRVVLAPQRERERPKEHRGEAQVVFENQEDVEIAVKYLNESNLFSKKIMVQKVEDFSSRGRERGFYNRGGRGGGGGGRGRRRDFGRRERGHGRRRNFDVRRGGGGRGGRYGRRDRDMERDRRRDWRDNRDYRRDNRRFSGRRDDNRKDDSRRDDNRREFNVRRDFNNNRKRKREGGREIDYGLGLDSDEDDLDDKDKRMNKRRKRMKDDSSESDSDSD